MQITLNDQTKGKIIEKSVRILNNGGIIVYPSDTVYGIAVDATNSGAIMRLDDLKKRRADQKYSYNFASVEMIEKFIEISDEQKNIFSKYLPGPYTFILNDEFSVRIPKDCIITEIVSAFRKPVTATSANISGEQPATNTKNLNAKIYLAADLIIEKTDIIPKQPSTIVDISKKPYRVVRHGELPFDES